MKLLILILATSLFSQEAFDEKSGTWKKIKFVNGKSDKIMLGKKDITDKVIVLTGKDKKVYYYIKDNQ